MFVGANSCSSKALSRLASWYVPGLGVRLFRIDLTLLSKNSANPSARSRALSCDGNFRSVFKCSSFSNVENNTRWLGPPSLIVSAEFHPWLKNWKARCRNGLSDDFGPLFTKPRNYLSSCNAIVAKGLVLCNQHIILATRMEFPPKEHQFSLLLTRKEKLPKCQEISIISAGGKNTSVLTLGGN